MSCAHSRRASSAHASSSGTPDESIPAVVRNAGREQLEVVFLGTGAAIPAKYRNVSGIFVNLFQDGGIMLDCGKDLFVYQGRNAFSYSTVKLIVDDEGIMLDCGKEGGLLRV